MASLKNRSSVLDESNKQNLHTIQRSSSKGKSRARSTSLTKIMLLPIFGICVVIYCLSSAEYYNQLPTSIEDISEGSHQQSFQTYKHTNSNLYKRSDRCSKDQMNVINEQLGLDKKTPYLSYATRCPDASWIEEYYAEESALGNDEDSFLGISVGCNKGYDAINTARMGMSNADFDKKAWSDAFLAAKGSVESRGACGQATKIDHQFHVTKPARKGEMHCVEPMPSTVALLTSASSTLGLESKGFIINGAAVASIDGTVQFPNGSAGTETISIGDCYKKNRKPSACQDVPMYSLQTYVERFVKSKGPINVLQIDVEGFDFDVLFGAGSVLDRTQYLEFEYNQGGNWGALHISDAVKLLDGKGFTCYWSGKKKLWRFNDCEFDIYKDWHGWSNIACVHRSQTSLAEKMEIIFLNTLLSASKK